MWSQTLQTIKNYKKCQIEFCEKRLAFFCYLSNGDVQKSKPSGYVLTFNGFPMCIFITGRTD